jgi:dipeptide/tripeptide permease
MPSTNPNRAKTAPSTVPRLLLSEIPLFEWVAIFVGMPLLYLLTGVLNRILSLAAGIVRRKLSRNAGLQNPRVLRPPFRLLLLALVIRWLVSTVPLPLLARQFWSTTALMIVVVACMWLLMLLNEGGERSLVRRRRSLSGAGCIALRNNRSPVALFQRWRSHPS